MGTLVVLRHVRVENANAIAGLTYGFPAITHFLGYTHALSRKLQQSHGLTLQNCGVVCHQQQLHAYSSGRDYAFALTRNPLTKEAKTAAFNEEGRMHLTVTLLMECHGTLVNGDHGAKALETHLAELCPSLRLAGGVITDIGAIRVMGTPEKPEDLRKLMRRLLPGFALLDRSELLASHYQALCESNPQAELLDAWLDFAALKYQALSEQDPQWCYQPKPAMGYLVSIQTGYRAISPLYAPGEVEKSRDPTTPFRFAEPVYGIGEWRGLHRITDLNQLLWQYHHQSDDYLCRSAIPVITEDYQYNEED